MIAVLGASSMLARQQDTRSPHDERADDCDADRCGSSTYILVASLRALCQYISGKQ